jgi:hypothetical protein
VEKSLMFSFVFHLGTTTALYAKSHHLLLSVSMDICIDFLCQMTYNNVSQTTYKEVVQAPSLSYVSVDIGIDFLC